jgi:hypothetical protein
MSVFSPAAGQKKASQIEKETEVSYGAAGLKSRQSNQKKTTIL